MFNKQIVKTQDQIAKCAANFFKIWITKDFPVPWWIFIGQFTNTPSEFWTHDLPLHLS